MFISFKVVLINLLIFIVGMMMSYKLGKQLGSDNAYDMGYKDCEKDWNFNKTLKYEFEDFLAAKGYAIDNNSKPKSLKALRQTIK